MMCIMQCVYTYFVDVVFTSGGTESNMMVLQTVVKHFKGQLPTDQLPHIITSNLEHDSIRIPLQKFLEEGLAGEML